MRDRERDCERNARVCLQSEHPSVISSTCVCVCSLCLNIHIHTERERPGELCAWLCILRRVCFLSLTASSAISLFLFLVLFLDALALSSLSRSTIIVVNGGLCYGTSIPSINDFYAIVSGTCGSSAHLALTVSTMPSSSSLPLMTNWVTKVTRCVSLSVYVRVCECGAREREGMKPSVYLVFTSQPIDN